MSPQARSDDELLLDVGAGDQQALAALREHTDRLVYANVLRALHDTVRTDTVAEEAFLEVRQQAARFDPSRTPAVIWILDLAHQLATERDRYDSSPGPGGPGPGGEGSDPHLADRRAVETTAD